MRTDDISAQKMFQMNLQDELLVYNLITAFLMGF